MVGKWVRAGMCGAAITFFCAQSLAARGELDAQEAPSPGIRLAVPPYAAASAVPGVRAARNPFAQASPVSVPPILNADRVPTLGARSPMEMPPDQPAAGPGEIPILPANAGAFGVPIPALSAPAGEPAVGSLQLIGVTTGDAPHALISSGTASDIYRVGDRVGGRTIGAITLDGVVFSDGTPLHISASL